MTSFELDPEADFQDEEETEDPTEEEIAERLREWIEEQESTAEITEKAVDWEAVETALNDATEKSSWWEVREYREGTDLAKAPQIWRESDSVPEAVRDLIEQVIDSTHWDWGQFESLSHAEAQRLVDLLEEKLTQPQGWSLRSLTNDIQREFGLDEQAAVGVAADTSHNVLSVARDEAWDRMEGSEEFEFDWVGPDDHRTTPVCEEIKAEVRDRGGGVSRPTLKQILRQKAQKYEGTSEGGGTPQRVEYWEPHYQCRHMPTRTNISLS